MRVFNFFSLFLEINSLGIPLSNVTYDSPAFHGSSLYKSQTPHYLKGIHEMTLLHYSSLVFSSVAQSCQTL